MQVHTKTKKIIQRVLLTLLIFAISFSILSMAVTVVFFHVAFPRTNDISPFSYTYADMADKGYDCRKLTVSSGDETLTGYLYPAALAKGLVVIAAGFGDSGSSHLGEMMAFTKAGFSVLCYDAAGVGESTGTSKGGLSRPAVDLHAVLDHVAHDAELSKLPILLYGHSAGGYAAANCVGEPSVKAAVLLCAFESPTRLMRESARDYVGVLADIEYPFILLENNILYTSEMNKSASESIENASVPVAVFEGAADDNIPVSERLSARLDGKNNVTITVSTDPLHSGHYGVWLSDSAVRYRNSCKETARIDRERANELDEDFINNIIHFYQRAVAD